MSDDDDGVSFISGFPQRSAHNGASAGSPFFSPITSFAMQLGAQPMSDDVGEEEPIDLESSMPDSPPPPSSPLLGITSTFYPQSPQAPLLPAQLVQSVGAILTPYAALTFREMCRDQSTHFALLKSLPTPTHKFFALRAGVTAAMQTTLPSLVMEALGGNGPEFARVVFSPQPWSPDNDQFQLQCAAVLETLRGSLNDDLLHIWFGHNSANPPAYRKPPGLLLIQEALHELRISVAPLGALTPTGIQLYQWTPAGKKKFLKNPDKPSQSENKLLFEIAQMLQGFVPTLGEQLRTQTTNRRAMVDVLVSCVSQAMNYAPPEPVKKKGTIQLLHRFERRWKDRL